MNLNELEQNFKKNIFRNEDDIKIHFHSEIIKPILEELNPEMLRHYKSEERLLAGGRTDATFQNISFELKKERYFCTRTGIDEALYGRSNRDHGSPCQTDPERGLSGRDRSHHH